MDILEMLLRSIRGESLKPFRYFDRGKLAVLHRGGASVSAMLERFALTGSLTWLACLIIQIIFATQFRGGLSPAARKAATGALAGRATSALARRSRHGEDHEP